MRRVLLVPLTLLLVSCMSKVQDEERLLAPSISSVDTIQVDATNANIQLVGKCPAGSKSIMIDINNSGFKAALASQGAMSSGSVVGTCNGGFFNVQYRIPNPEVAQKFTFKLKVVDQNGRHSEIVSRDYAYTPNLTSKSGGVVASGGAYTTGGAGTKAIVTLGEPTQEKTLTGGAGTKFKVGFKGTVQ